MHRQSLNLLAMLAGESLKGMSRESKQTQDVRKTAKFVFIKICVHWNFKPN